MLFHRNYSHSLSLIICQSLFLFFACPVYSSDSEPVEASRSSTCVSDDFNMYGFTEEDFKNAQDEFSSFSYAPQEAVITDYLDEQNLDFTTKGTNESYGDIHSPCFGLSIDGGGIRGVMPALWLQDLKTAYAEDGEYQIKEPLHELFDYVGGTSIGGIISLGVAHGLPLNDIVNLFKNDRGKIFTTERIKLKRFIDFFSLFGCRFSAKKLENLLRQTFGDSTRLSDLKTNVLVTACTTEGKPHLFQKEKKNSRYDYRLWEVARSTSAAPNYFKAYKPLYASTDLPTFVDGGIWVNNPSPLLTASIVKKFQDGDFNPAQLHILSLGTGNSINQSIPKSAGKIVAGKIIDSIMSSHNRGNHMLMGQLLGDHYCRVNAEMANPIDLADTSQEAYDTMVEYAALDVHQKQIQAFVEQTAGRLRTKLESQDE